MNMLLKLLTLIKIFLIDSTSLGKAFDSQCNNKYILPKRLKRNATCEGNAIKRSNKLVQKSSEIRNKRQLHFRASICPNPKWHSCFYYDQLSVPIDVSANFNFLTLSCPIECNKYHYQTQDSQQLPSNQFKWGNNRSCFRNDCNNDCDNDSSPCNSNNKHANISAWQMQSNSSSKQDKKPKHSASHQESG